MAFCQGYDENMPNIPIPFLSMRFRSSPLLPNMLKYSHMSKKKRASRQSNSYSSAHFTLSPEAKKSIVTVLLFAVGIILFLALFHLAGNFGAWLNLQLSLFLGIDRYLVPFLFLMIGFTLAFPDRGRISGWNYFGLVFFFLSFNAILNLLFVNLANPLTDITRAGGYFGQILALGLSSFLGYWGSLVISLSLLCVSVMLIFNTSLSQALGVHKQLSSWAQNKISKTKEDQPVDLDDENEEDENLLIDDTDEMEDDEEFAEPEPKKSFFHVTPLKEQVKEETVLTSKKRRNIAIPLDLLEHSTSKAQPGDIERNKEIIERTFHEFGIDVEMGETSVGPTVTQFTLRPSQGIKISRIVALQNDLALALAAHPLRLEAPIPGKSLVGIEVPNTKVATVTLRDVIDTKEFTKEATGLSIPLGKDVSGKPWTIDLAKMPHLLVAGSTGSGKSVCLNELIVSLLYQNGPDDLKLILVDPKRVELTMFAGIPHLLVPPITNTDDTVNALKWTVREMERRLDVLSKFGARNIDQYNEKSEERMPKIVVVIDELADLMTSSGREVEGTIVRIAQMARAVGIHLVLATQRPSVDVITGLIKANVPGRIAFAVASQTDSRTILDMSGAEKLLGRGDMLFTSAEVAKPKRIQGAYASNDEIERVVAFLRQKGEPDYNLAITEITKAGTVFNSTGDDEPLFDQAVEIVIKAGKASTSFLQRHLKVGYSRAARMIDLMEESGVVGPGEGAKPREILVDSWPPGGNFKEGMPTADDDYFEAEKPFKEKDLVEELEDDGFLDPHVEPKPLESEDTSEQKQAPASQKQKPNWDEDIDDAWFAKEE